MDAQSAKLEERVQEVIRQTVRTTHLTDDAHLIAGLGMDSLDLVELEIELEEEFNISLDRKLFNDERWPLPAESPPPDYQVKDVYRFVREALDARFKADEL